MNVFFDFNRIKMAMVCGVGALLCTSPALGQSTLLVSDQFGDKVVRFDYPSGLAFDHFVGAELSPLITAQYMTLTPDGNIAVASFDNNSVQLYSGQTGRFLQTLVAPGSGGLNGPVGLTFGPDNNLYVAGFWSDDVKRYDGNTGAYIDTVATGVNEAFDIAFSPDGTMFASSRASDRVMMFDPDTAAFLGDVDMAGIILDGPAGMTADSAGNIYVSGQNSGNVVRIDANTFTASVFVSPSVSLDLPQDIAFDEEGNLLVVSNSTGSVLKYSQFGSFLGVVISPATDGGLFTTYGLLLYTPNEDCVVDMNDDGTLNFFDISAFLSAFAAGCP